MSRAKNGSSTKIGVVWQKSDFLAKNWNFGPKKRESLLYPNHWVAISFFSIRYDIDTIWGFFSRYDTIRYDMRASKKTFFLRNFRRIFGEFSEFSANFLNFRRIFGEFSEFSANFWNFRRKKTKKSLVLRISRYSIWEVRYDILFDIRKSPIYRHSINSRYDKLITV